MKYYAKLTEPDGEYIDANGTRYSINAARRVRTAEGVNVGYTAFPSLQDALAAWGLCLFNSAEPAQAECVIQQPPTLLQNTNSNRMDE